MTALLQILVILTALLIVRMGLRKHSGHLGKASRRLSVLALAVAMVITVLFPNITNVAARVVGVGRGTDLLLYLTVLAFIMLTLHSYLRMQEQRDTLFRLARRVAILEARIDNKRLSKK